ncbi:MAG: ATP synthase F1 subunit delta [Sinomicrobium sp.]|nr:ATP synthase F1 subunit delta [Sinomicrobium sp.]
MTGTRAAIRYAKAVLDLARERDAAAALDADMKLIRNTINKSRDIQLLLKNPVIKAGLKKAALKAVFSEVAPITHALIDILADNKRLELLGVVAEKYIILYDRLKGKEVAIVTTAVPLTDEFKVKVMAKVKELTPHQVTVENKIDESIIGGFILRIGDLQYDASIANTLNRLKRTFHTNVDVSIMN